MTGLRITILTLTSVDPSLQEKDLEFAKVIREGLERLAIDANIEIIDLTQAKYSPDHRFVADIIPQYRQRGTRVSPVFFLNGELISFGKVPTVDEFVKVIEDRFEFVDVE